MRVRGYWPLRADRAVPLPIAWADWIDDDDGGNSGRRLRSRGPVLGSSASGKVFIPTNPFTDPTALQALKESFAEQPNWKAAVMEGTTWEGSADENAAKWRKLNRIDV